MRASDKSAIDGPWLPNLVRKKQLLKRSPLDTSPQMLALSLLHGHITLTKMLWIDFGHGEGAPLGEESIRELPT